MARPAPRELQERRQLVSDQRNRLEQRLGHAADAGAGAESLGLPLRAVREAEIAAANLRPASLDATSGEVSRPLAAVVEGSATRKDEGAIDVSITMGAAISRLPERDQQLLDLRLSHDLTQAEIGQAMGLSARQVSRLLRRALDHRRPQLALDQPISA